ncbi:MAG: ATP-dependent metallopeptidase FtsH/Yme1/Tma family protein, partial [Minisyncoccales bacterium]
MLKQIIKIFLSIVFIFFILSFFFSFFSSQTEKKEISLSQLVNDINDNNVKKITVIGETLLITYHDNSQKISKKEAEAALSQTLSNLGVQRESLKKVEIEQKNESRIWGLLANALYLLSPLLFLFIFFWLFSRQAKGGIGQTFSFIKARAQILEKGSLQKEKITFNDVADLKEAKEELKEVVDFLKNPKKYEKMGAKVPKGV